MGWHWIRDPDFGDMHKQCNNCRCRLCCGEKCGCAADTQSIA